LSKFFDDRTGKMSPEDLVDRQIHRLALAGRSAALASLLAEDHRWLMARGLHGRTALHCAAIAGSTTCLKVLLFRSQYRHVVLERPQSLLAEKALLIEQRTSFIDVPEASLGWTSLFYAIESGSLAAMSLLLESGADPNHLSNSLRKPLDYAKSGAVIELLNQYGASW
jgi:Ankyrin repeats (many copies)/Ankyrin repeat